MAQKNRDPFPVTSFANLANAESGHWWFCARNKILLWVLRNRCGNISSFLEIGCGTGFVLEEIRRAYPTAEIFGAEYFDEGLEFARKRVPSAKLNQLDARLLNQHECYDVIGAFDVIEHIDEDEIVLKNLANALQYGGKLLITVPQHRWLWSATDERACHVRRYSRRELVDKVRLAGLEVEYLTSFVSLLLPLMWFSRRAAGRIDKNSRSEFEISEKLNWLLEKLMGIELRLLKWGLTFPLGGSLLLLAKKRYPS